MRTRSTATARCLPPCHRSTRPTDSPTIPWTRCPLAGVTVRPATPGGVDGSYDQRKVEERPDVLVYTTAPFSEELEVTGPMTPTLYVSSDAKDTDFTVKILDVPPDGRAFTLDESIQRMRHRDGYDKPLVWMELGKVDKVTLLPLTTSNYFDVGQRPRIEVSSSNFPGVRAQSQHRRTQLRRGDRRGGAQRGESLGQMPIITHRDRRETTGPVARPTRAGSTPPADPRGARVPRRRS